VRVTKCNRILHNHNYWKGRIKEKEKEGGNRKKECERINRSKNKAIYDIGE
jgi:hypothetical protein